ncbi:hypothetical protein HQ520_06275 [bacterium]|nr:hypothetical protein [bacterium]
MSVCFSPIRNSWAASVLFLILAVLSPSLAKAQTTVLYETEEFQFHGGWWLRGEGSALLGNYLSVHSGMTEIDPNADRQPVMDAMTAIELPEAGIYRLWVRARDYATQTGMRKFTITIDGLPADEQAGDHGKDAWAWELVGTRPLGEGEHMLGLQDTAAFFARADAILLTTDNDLDPNRLGTGAFEKYRREPKKVEKMGEGTFTLPSFDPKSAKAETARLENDFLRVVFSAGEDQAGKSRLARRLEMFMDGRWYAMPITEEEILFQVYAEQTEPPTQRYPSWPPSRNSQVEVWVGGKPYRVNVDAKNPFYAGARSVFLPRSARQVDDQTVEVEYETAEGKKALGRWTLATSAHHLNFSLAVTAEKDGFYSVGMCAFQDWKKDQVDFVQLPPLFQLQRLPDRPLMVTSSVTPHPLALIQTRPEGFDGKTVSFAVVADPEKLPFEWATASNAVYGFSLVNHKSLAQPCIFTPVLGLDGSKWRKGERKNVSWNLVAHPGDWKDGMEYVSRQVMKVTDYRKPVNASLTDAILNMIDLMANDEAGGWSERLRGFYDIETGHMGKQAAPLAVLSAGVLSRDEEFFARRSVPTIEFTLSRRRADITIGSETKKGSELGKQLNVPTQWYGTAYWQGVYALLGKMNPWMEEFILPNGEVFNSAYSARPVWPDRLALYRHRPEADLLRQIEEEARAYLTEAFYGRHEDPVAYEMFYNIHFYPEWWDLLDLYDVTGNELYMRAAEEGAFHTLAGLRSHPPIPEGEVRIHEGGSVDPTVKMWFREGKEHRLGVPRRPGDTPEKMVPAWQVSQTGLGLEQPSTYFSTGARMRNIMQATWAPHLLRAYQATGREILRTYARNTTIGRFANYPGYYIALYTDKVQDPRYPYEGPDITDFYYHHIPVHFGFATDYLFSQLSLRSGNRIKFPWVKQKNYAWFNFRVYGTQSGEIFGETGAVPWLHRSIAKVGSPEVDWLAARSTDRFWIMLMSQSRDVVEVPVTLNPEWIGMEADPLGWRFENGSDIPAEVRIADLKSVAIPAMGLVTLSFPATLAPFYAEQAPIEHGHVRHEMTPWGELHAFRIRGPFGGDALYVVLLAEQDVKAQATLTVQGLPKPLECKEFPYEFSYYPIPPEAPLFLDFEISGPGSKDEKRVSIAPADFDAGKVVSDQKARKIPVVEVSVADWKPKGDKSGVLSAIDAPARVLLVKTGGKMVPVHYGSSTSFQIQRTIQLADIIAGQQVKVSGTISPGRSSIEAREIEVLVRSKSIGDTINEDSNYVIGSLRRAPNRLMVEVKGQKNVVVNATAKTKILARQPIEPRNIPLNARVWFPYSRQGNRVTADRVLVYD